MERQTVKRVEVQAAFDCDVAMEFLAEGLHGMSEGEAPAKEWSAYDSPHSKPKRQPEAPKMWPPLCDFTMGSWIDSCACARALGGWDSERQLQ